MKLVKKVYNHYVSVDTEIDINNSETYNLYSVYFINCLVNNNYSSWLINQINLIKGFNSTIYIIAIISKLDEVQFTTDVLKLFPGVNVLCFNENEYEYRGILKVWEIGQIHNKKNDIILYFHSKGVTHNPSYEMNRNDHYNIILKDINKIKEIFTIFPKIDKIGYSAGGIGWIWYNFWYVRGSYINNVEKPIKTERRHYYEDWLGRQIDSRGCDGAYGVVTDPESGALADDSDDKICDNERPLSYYKNTLNSCYGFHNDKNVANIGSYYNPSDNKYYNLDENNSISNNDVVPKFTRSPPLRYQIPRPVPNNQKKWKLLFSYYNK